MWTNSTSKFRKQLDSPGYGHIRLAVGQHVLGYDLRWPYPTIHNLSIFCYQPTKFCIILTRFRRLFDDSQTHRVTFPINLFTPVTQPSSGVYLLTPTMRSSSMETVHFPPLSGLYPLLVFGASFLYHLVRQTRTKDVHIRIYNLKPTCWLHYDTAPLNQRQKKRYADLITYINCVQLLHFTDQNTASSYSKIKSQRKNLFTAETNDVQATGNAKGFIKTRKGSHEDNTFLNETTIWQIFRLCFIKRWTTVSRMTISSHFTNKVTKSRATLQTLHNVSSLLTLQNPSSEVSKIKIYKTTTLPATTIPESWYRTLKGNNMSFENRVLSRILEHKRECVRE